jgi:glycine betaine catabolism A
MKNFQKTSQTFVPGSMTLPQKYYISPEVFSEERKKIFEKFWLCLGHVSRIQKAGDYFLQEILGESVIVLRDRNNTTRAFYNSCRHRGTRICEEKFGRFAKSIQCSYHAWTYSLEGKLIGAPFMKEVANFPWEDNGLIELPITIWEGLIFVSLVSDPIPFEELYAPILEKLVDWNVGDAKIGCVDEYEVKANWKYIFQNFNECYHCPTIHPMLNKFTNYTSAENDLSEGPFLGGYMEITGGESMTMSGRMCGLPLGNLTDKTSKKGYYYTILGNLLLNIHPDYVMYHLLFPRNQGETKIESSWLFNAESVETAGETFRPAEAIDFWRETNMQDWHVCELSQRGVQSAGYRQGWYSPRESLLAAFDIEYLKLME